MNADGAALESGPPANLRYRFRLQPGARLKELWQSRELVWTLGERELRARYKQAFLGFAWSVISPVVLMVVFTLFFRRVVKVNTGGAPYALFSYLGLLPWTFFSNAVSNGGQVLLLNKHLLNKVYCPREVFPLSMVFTSTFDTTLALFALGMLFVITGFMPKATSYWIPVLLAIQFAFTTGITLIVAAAVVYLRDVRHGLPLILQLGLFATPVAYGMDLVPRHLWTVYAAINPLAGVIDGYRRTILGGRAPDWHLVIPGAITSAVVLVFGYAFFKRLEAGFADVA